MKKLFTITIFLLVLCVSINAVQKRIAKRTNEKLNIASIAKEFRRYQTNLEGYFDEPISVTALNLNKTEISANCSEINKNCSNEKIIEVQAIAADSNDTNNIKYVYKVSGGKIIGKGANVKWDLSDTKTGNYTITASVSQLSFDGTRWESYGRTQTRVVIIKE